jgi:hypothetical protein
MHQMAYDYSENYKVLGWDNIEVRARKFKALRRLAPHSYKHVGKKEMLSGG